MSDPINKLELSGFEKYCVMLVEEMMRSMVRQIQKADLLDVSYQSRIKLPDGLLKECYESIDPQKIKRLIIERLEQEMADKLVNKMVTEFAGDIKQVMSNKELREDLRGILRQKIKDARDLLTDE